MSYEDDERLVKDTINRDRRLQAQTREAIRNKRFENVRAIIKGILKRAGRSLTHLQQLIQAVKDWFDDSCGF